MEWLFTQPSVQTQIKENVTGLCEGNSPVTGEFPAQRASNAEIFPFDDVIMKYVHWNTYSQSFVVTYVDSTSTSVNEMQAGAPYTNMD